MHRGFIALWRKFREWGWYSDGPVKDVFIELLLTANHEDKEHAGVLLKRGQLLTGRHKLADILGLTEKQVRRALNVLEKGQEIERKRASKFSIITVCKYDEYQQLVTDRGPAKGQQEGRQRASRGPHTNHYNHENHLKNKTYRPDFVSQEDWSDLLDHRKKHPKKPTNSDRALKILAGKIQKTMADGFTSTQIVEKIIARNWQTIEPEWMVNSTNKENTNGTGQKRNESRGQDKRSDILSKAARHVLSQRIEEAGNR